MKITPDDAARMLNWFDAWSKTHNTQVGPISPEDRALGDRLLEFDAENAPDESQLELPETEESDESA